MNRTEVLDILIDIFREQFDGGALMLTAATAPRDVPGWDSAKTVMLVLSVEERFEIRLRSREIDALRCIGDWVDLVEAHRAPNSV